MTLIVDASVAVKFFVDEDGSDAARALATRDDLIAPDLILAEAYNAVAKRVRRREATPEHLTELIPLLRSALTDLVPLSDLIDEAAALARRLDHPIYDCVYLAAARRENSVLVTADERLFSTSRKARIRVQRL